MYLFSYDSTYFTVCIPIYTRYTCTCTLSRTLPVTLNMIGPILYIQSMSHYCSNIVIQTFVTYLQDIHTLASNKRCKKITCNEFKLASFISFVQLQYTWCHAFSSIQMLKDQPSLFPMCHPRRGTFQLTQYYVGRELTELILLSRNVGVIHLNLFTL